MVFTSLSNRCYLLRIHGMQSYATRDILVLFVRPSANLSGCMKDSDVVSKRLNLLMPARQVFSEINAPTKFQRPYP